MTISPYRYHTVPRLFSRLRSRKCCQAFRSVGTATSKSDPGLFRARIAMLLSTVGTGAAIYFLLPDTSRSSSTVGNALLSSSYFTRATLTSSNPCGPDTKELTLTIPPHLLPSKSTFTPIWSIFIKDDDIQVERPYTPLEGVDNLGRMRFWIKKYPKGEVSRWLHSKQVGDQVEIRGPLKTWLWQEGVWDEVVMISGGTGVTPFCQLFHTVISRAASVPEFSKTRFTLLHSSRTPKDLPPSDILEPFISFAAKNPERFRFRIFVDASDGHSRSSSFPEFEVGRIDKAAIRRSLDKDKPRKPWWRRPFESSELEHEVPRNILFLVCGPEPMVDAIAGPFGRNFSQGPIGGILGEMGFTSNQVRKL